MWSYGQMVNPISRQISGWTTYLWSFTENDFISSLRTSAPDLDGHTQISLLKTVLWKSCWNIRDWLVWVNHQVFTLCNVMCAHFSVCIVGAEAHRASLPVFPLVHDLNGLIRKSIRLICILFLRLFPMCAEANWQNSAHFTDPSLFK